MKILVISSTPWNNKNSFGLSFTNIFDGIEDLTFANIYCSAGSPENPFNMKCFQISESMLVANLRSKKTTVGRIVNNSARDGIERTISEQKQFNIARTLRWQVLFWARDFLWKIGRWKNSELCGFLDEFKPDVIFQPVYYSSYMNDIAQFVKEYTGTPMVGYISDDCYTLKQLRFSPLYWIDRFWKRIKVKKTINLCEILYVISDVQKLEYEKIFKPTCKILTKCADFPNRVFNDDVNKGEITLMYGGNIGSGRWKSLALIAQAVERLNSEGFNIRFDIYSDTPKTKIMQKALKRDCCYLHKAIPYGELIKIQTKTDILVHVEGLSLKNRLEVRQSFSTKLVDFFKMGKCIFAIGTEDIASIKHLIDSDAAVVAKSKDQVYEKLKFIACNPEVILEYEKNAYKCGAEHHSKEIIQDMIINDLNRIMDANK